MSDLIARLEERRGIAAKATPGPWAAMVHPYSDRPNSPNVHGVYSLFRENGVPLAITSGLFTDTNTGHIAANDPQTVTLLLDVAIAAERRRWLMKAMNVSWTQELQDEWLKESGPKLDAALAALESHMTDGDT